MIKRIESVNEFVIKFANVNGSGSASANELFAKAILRMGVPVSPRNIFPSNIQGLPTWYEVRVSEQGRHHGAALDGAHGRTGHAACQCGTGPIGVAHHTGRKGRSDGPV